MSTDIPVMKRRSPTYICQLYLINLDLIFSNSGRWTTHYQINLLWLLFQQTVHLLPGVLLRDDTRFPWTLPVFVAHLPNSHCSLYDMSRFRQHHCLPNPLVYAPSPISFIPSRSIQFISKDHRGVSLPL